MIWVFVATNAVLCLVIGGLCLWINRLINKLMSRNYYDYKITQSVNLKQDAAPKTVKIYEDEIEDLGYLNGI